MIFQTTFNNKSVHINLKKGIDLSIAIEPNKGVNAFHIPQAKFEPIRVGSFVGSVKEGGSANCENLLINAHGNGTHTECVGHISKERICINDCLKEFFFFAHVLSVQATEMNGDFVILEEELKKLKKIDDCEALIIRTLPNNATKLTANYSGTNPCYMSVEFCKQVREMGFKHLLLDLPSVDREEDAGALAAHKAFWDVTNVVHKDMTITELIFVPDEVEDGVYFLNIQIASLMTDASPSKPILFSMLD
jgi:kynurenine formamidase